MGLTNELFAPPQAQGYKYNASALQSQCKTRSSSTAVVSLYSSSKEQRIAQSRKVNLRAYFHMAGKDVVPHPDHFESLKEVTVTDNATVQGMLMNVSPMKKGQSPYFEAKLTDGEDQMRVVGFSSSLRKRMAGLEEIYEPVALESCKIKRGKYSEQLEVMINPSTKFSTSPKKFDLRKISKMICGDVSVSDVDSKTAYDNQPLTSAPPPLL